jgi:GTP-binding protein Era
MNHKAGFVNIIGNPNVGKSTLMNALVGEKLSIITSKAQTTRHRILGIVNGDDFQIIYSDTPGIIIPAYQMQDAMMKFVDAAMKDADVFLLVSEVNETFKNQEVLQKLSTTKIPVIVVLNKIDLSEQEKVVEKIGKWNELLPKAEIIPVSALREFNIQKVFQTILDKIPECAPYFDKDTLTDRPQKFFVSEIIREKILKYYNKEIPYSVEVEVESFVEEETIIRIRAIIYAARESQKGILIGHQGVALKRVGTEARRDLEEFLGKHVFIELVVKVNKDWRNNESQLKKFGYYNQ